MRKALCGIFLTVFVFFSMWTCFQLIDTLSVQIFICQTFCLSKFCLTFQSIVQLMSYRCVNYHRALDNQVYAAGVSVARDESASYVSLANSTLVSPW